MPTDKKIESPELLLEYFKRYVKDEKADPYIVEHVTPKGEVVTITKERALTFVGFEAWLKEHDYIKDLGDYEKNKDERYTEYAPIISHIKVVIKRDQIGGGMAGVYNPNLTARLNGLADNQNHESPKGTMSPQSTVNITLDGKDIDVKVI